MEAAGRKEKTVLVFSFVRSRCFDKRKNSEKNVRPSGKLIESIQDGYQPAKNHETLFAVID